MANDDPILTTMRFIPQHEVVQKYDAILPDYLITPAMKESKAFKTYYAFATRKATPKPKYVRRTSKDKTEQAPKASTGKRLKAVAKGAKSGKKRQHAQGLETLSEIALTKAEQLRIVTKRSLIQTHSSHASGSGAHEGTGVTLGVPDVPTYKSDDEEISWKTSSDDDDDNEGDDDAVNDDHDDADNQSERTESDNKGDAFVHPKFTTHEEEESSDPRVHTPSQSEPSDTEANVDVAQSEYTEEEEGRDTDMTDAPQITQVIEDTHVTLTPVNPEGSKLKEVVDVAVQLKSDRIREDAQAKNEDFFNKVDNNMKKIIKEQVNAQVKKKIDKILPRIEKLLNEQLKSEVLIRSSNEANTSHAVAANLSKLELKKILIDNMKSNKSIDISDEQKNLYKALVDAYKVDKALLDNYGDIVTIKRHRDNVDNDQEPSAGTDRGCKRKRARKEPESSSALREKTSTITVKSTKGSKSHQQSADQSALAEVPMHTVDDFEDPTHQEFDTGLNDDQPEEEDHPHPDWQEDPRESFDELMDTPFDFSAFMMNQLKVDTLTPELLVRADERHMQESGQRYLHDLRKPLPLIPNSRGRQVIPFAHFINNDLAYLSGGVSSQTYSTSITKTNAVDYGNIKWIEDLVPSLIWSEVPVSYHKESAKDVYSRRRIIAVTKHQIVEWHGYKHLDWITVRRADDKLYSFKEGDFKRLRLQDMLILLV
ncbi:hypothetical protein Tco_1124095 [Tanacetum coccineum]|uniref:Uncharacterized protein n=1 Tax=Tanacetum coccineum TaxID=301880 RepID=A0ABQ5J567_9ASTR